MPKLSTIPVWTLRAVGRFSADTRELAELGYQFTAPFVLDSTRSQQLLGLAPTPTDHAVAATVAWWRGQLTRQPAA